MTERPAIDVVVASFRRADLLRSCLSSLRDAAGTQRLNVCVVDNASGDGTAEVAREEFPEFELLVNERNRGFAAASNQGIERGSAPFVLLLNPDARLDAETLAPLLRVLESDGKVAAVGPKLVRPDGSLDHAAKRSFPTVAGALAHFTGLGPVLGTKARQYTAPEVAEGPVDAINGAFMLLRRQALDEVGLFDEGYWMYMEDLDLCYRLKQAGWQVYYEPRATAWHLKGGSAGEIRTVRLNAWFHYGMYRFYRKFYAPRRSWPVNLAVYAGIGAKLIASIFRGWVRRAVRACGRVAPRATG